MWSIGRWPLVFGGNLPDNDEFTVSLLSNDEVLAVNQKATASRELFGKGNQIAWLAETAGSAARAARYLAVFKIRDTADEEIRIDWAGVGLGKKAAVRDLWAKKEMVAAENGRTFNVKPQMRPHSSS